MTTNNYQKYLKYKSKYLDLKKELSGRGGSSNSNSNSNSNIDLEKYIKTKGKKINTEIEHIKDPHYLYCSRIYDINNKTSKRQFSTKIEIENYNIIINLLTEVIKKIEPLRIKKNEIFKTKIKTLELLKQDYLKQYNTDKINETKKQIKVIEDKKKSFFSSSKKIDKELEPLLKIVSTFYNKIYNELYVKYFNILSTVYNKYDNTILNYKKIIENFNKIIKLYNGNEIPDCESEFTEFIKEIKFLQKKPYSKRLVFDMYIETTSLWITEELIPSNRLTDRMKEDMLTYFGNTNKIK